MFETIAHFLKIILIIIGVVFCLGFSIAVWYVAYEMKSYE